MAETPLSPAASVSERDRITAGLVLARAMAEAPPPEATAWQHLADFHASVVQPLLRAPEAPESFEAPEDLERDRQQSLRWAGALDGADVLMRLAESALDLGALPDEAVQDLIDLCELVRATDPEGPLPDPSAADLLVGDPHGGYVVSALTSTTTHTGARPRVSGRTSSPLSTRSCATSPAGKRPRPRGPSSPTSTGLPGCLWRRPRLTCRWRCGCWAGSSA